MHATKDRFGLKSPFAALHHVALIVNEIKKVDNLSPIQQMGPGVRAYFFSDSNGIVLEVMAPSDRMRLPMLDDPDPA